MDPSSALVVYNTSKTSKFLMNTTSTRNHTMHVSHSLLYRFGSGLILQAKVELSPTTGETDPIPPKKRSLLRRISTQLFSGRSTRRNHSIVEEEPDAQPPSQTAKQTNPPLHRQLTRQLTRMFSRTSDNAEPPAKPKYQIAPLHVFVQERFPGAAKLEEHEVCCR